MFKKILSVLAGKQDNIPPIWIMRQAGRYLEEYRIIRASKDSFLDLCYDPIAATEVTLQPIKKFHLDAAIIFADILLLPNALGMELSFKNGPIFRNIKNEADVNKLNIDKIDNILKPIYKTIELTKEQLPENTGLIGFAGGVWSVLCYMLGSGSKNFEEAKEFIAQNPKLTTKLVDILVEATIIYLKKQIDAGIEIIQIFDSWASLLNAKDFQNLVIEPTSRVIQALKQYKSDIYIIGFPRGSGINYLEYINKLELDCISVDYTWDLKTFITIVEKNIVIQGNLDPYILAYGDADVIKAEIIRILDIMKNRSYIFNLGHGILKETPVKNLQLLINIIRNG